MRVELATVCDWAAFIAKSLWVSYECAAVTSMDVLAGNLPLNNDDLAAAVAAAAAAVATAAATAAASLYRSRHPFV